MPKYYDPKCEYRKHMDKDEIKQRRWTTTIEETGLRGRYDRIIVVEGVKTDTKYSFGHLFPVFGYDLGALTDYIVDLHNAELDRKKIV